MLRFLASRLGTAVIVLIALTLIVFVLSRVIPADPAVVYAGPKAPPEELARIREKLGFDQPLILQYFDYLGGLVTEIGATRSPRSAPCSTNSPLDCRQPSSCSSRPC
jgi:ABC-type dipeptide/oligopeptide/nickel transport system permease component